MGDRLGIAGAAGFFFFLNLYEHYDFFKIIFILDNTHTNFFLVCTDDELYDFLKIIFILDNILTLTCFLVYFIDVKFIL